MEAAVKDFIFLSFFISLCTSLVAGDGECAYSSCGSEGIGVQFPFNLQGREERSCGYPGFSLSCNKSNRTFLDLGASGKFPVRVIDYVKQEVQIYDQDECLPRRLMNFDLTGTPFMAYNYLSINFYNCSSNFSSPYVEPISCLSTSNYQVYAVIMPGFASRGTYILGTCEKYATAIVPMEVFDQVWYLIDIMADLQLQWDAPDCGECVAQGGTCGFKNRRKNEIGCFSHPPRRHGLSRTAKYVLGFGIGAPGLLFIVLMARYVSLRLKSLDHSNYHSHTELSSSVLPQPPILIVGIDEAVIQSYPKIVLGESRRLAKAEDNICAICLSAYQAKETLKTIPDCNHSFHAACIDQWLRRNVTCPLCRNVPLQLPMPPPV